MNANDANDPDRGMPWLESDRRPPRASDAQVEAVGKLTEALETIERARGRLYDFHQLTGHADEQLADAAARLEAAGEIELAEELRTSIIGRNVIEGRWTFQVVEEYDATYWGPLRDFEHQTRERVLDGVAHVYESELKEANRTDGRRHHESRPAPGE